MVVCVLVPRFALIAALGDRREQMVGQPAALAPEPGRAQKVGEVSAAAEAFGVAAGMQMGEAIARCPGLHLVPPDPEGARTLWNAVLDRLERIGAEVESDVPGAAFFEADGLRRLHGGNLDGVLTAARRALTGRVAPTPPRPRLAAGPSRFCAHVAALHTRARRAPRVIPAGAACAFLAPLSVALLRSRPELAAMPETLARLGIRTLGELAALPPSAVAERFGHPGLLALDLAHGRDTPLDPRRPPEPVAERLALPEATSGQQLERALELLVARVLARPERRGRTLRSVALSARFVEGGTWRLRLTLRQASADAARIRIAVAPRLVDLPAPAESLGLEVEAFGPPAHDQPTLVEDHDAARRARLGEAVRQARQAAGAEAAMRLLEVDPDSRIPERRNLLMPYEGDTP
jgi:protein ImuB